MKEAVERGLLEEVVEEAEDVAGHAPRGAEAGSAEERWALVDQSPAAFAGSTLARRALLGARLRTLLKTLLRTLLRTLLKSLLKRPFGEAVERGC